jgi:hypothetical protein
MSHYTVELAETVIYSVDVEARNEFEAGNLARAIWAQSANPRDDFSGYGQGVEVEGVTKLED